jgi:glycosyltransferase involved in cell wall biosynthesis
MQAYELSGNPAKIAQVRSRMNDAFGEGHGEPAAPLLSIAMIVKNEEEHLSACFSSIRGLWDELIIVDTGSQDNTLALAKAEGAKIFEQPWNGDFSAARNRSLEECKGRWIMWLDADDVLLPEDRAQIRKLIESQEPRKAYALLVKNSQDGGLTGSVFNQIRLVPNLKQIRFEGKVHEQLTPALQSLGIPIEFLPYRVIHTGYTNPDTIKQKQKRNLELMLEDLKDSPQKVNAMKFFAVGNSYLDLGEFETAAEWYRKSLLQAEKIGEDRHILEIIPVKLAECSSNLGKRDEGLAMIDAFLQRNPLQPNGIYLRAQLRESLGKMDQAAEDFGRLMFFQEQTTLLPVDFQQIRIRACKFLADYWLRKGQQQLALEMLRLGVAVGKGQMAAGLKVASLYFEHEQYSACMIILEFARQLVPSPQVFLSLGKAQIMLDDANSALKILEEANQTYPRDLEISQLLEDLRQDLSR